jgi:hypothetical protein
VSNHLPKQTHARQGNGRGDAITGKAGKQSGGRLADDPAEHVPQQGRDRCGHWLKGTSGNPRGRVPGPVGNDADLWLAQLLKRLADPATPHYLAGRRSRSGPVRG